MNKTFIYTILFFTVVAIQPLKAQKKAKKLFHKATVLLKQGDYQGALIQIDAAIDKADNTHKANYIYYKAMTYHVIDDTLNARKYYQEVVDRKAYGLHKLSSNMLALIENEPRNKKEIEISNANQKKSEAAIASLADSSQHNKLKIKEVNSTVEDVPFSIIESIPVLPACKFPEDNASRKNCLNVEIKKIISRNFYKTLATDLDLSGLVKITANFVIDKNGEVTGIKTRATNPFLRLEAKRVISLIPKMIPGMQRDKPVRVAYALPIKFKVN